MGEFKVNQEVCSDISRKYASAISRTGLTMLMPLRVNTNLSISGQSSKDVSIIKQNLNICTREINQLYSDLIGLRNGIEAVRNESAEADINIMFIFQPFAIESLLKKIIDRMKIMLGGKDDSIITITNNIVSKLKEWSEQTNNNQVEKSESEVEPIVIILNPPSYDPNEIQEIPVVDSNDVQPSDGYSNTVDNIQKTEYWESRVGSTVGIIINENGNFSEYYGSGNISYTSGYEGECTWYAYGRFYEVTGIKLKSAYNANRWLSANQNDPNVKIIDVPVAGSIAVNTNGTYGHVMFVEYVTYDEKGNPIDIYFTEANWGKGSRNGQYDAGTDGVLKKLSYHEFINQKKPSGYIAAA